MVDRSQVRGGVSVVYMYGGPSYTCRDPGGSAACWLLVGWFVAMWSAVLLDMARVLYRMIYSIMVTHKVTVNCFVSPPSRRAPAATQEDAPEGGHRTALKRTIERTCEAEK